MGSRAIVKMKARTQGSVFTLVVLEHNDVQLVAVCDVNTSSYGYGYRTGGGFPAGKKLGGKPGQERVNAYYVEKTGVGQ